MRSVPFGDYTRARPMKKQVAEPVAAKLRKLALLARELRGGEHFEITRLTTLKSRCEDPSAAGRFALHLAERSQGRATKKYKPLIATALRQLKKYLASPSDQAPEPLWHALRELEDSQNEIRDTRWGRVRTIHCKEALLAEHALRCATRPRESAHWGYQAARQYAERYNPRYGTGLIPESASAVEDIVAFWARYYFGRDSKKVLALANHAQPDDGCGYPNCADVKKIKPENLVKYKTAPEEKRLHKGCPK